MVALKLSQSQRSSPTLHTFSAREFLPLPPEQIWYIQSGVVKTQSWTVSGCPILLGIWGAGDVVGRLLATTDPYQIQCMTDVEATLWEGDRCSEFTTALLNHIRQTNTLLEILHQPQAEVVLFQLLNWLSQRFGLDHATGRQINLRLTHQDLADMTGLTRVTVTRLLVSLDQRGLIQRRQRRISITPDTSAFWHYQI